MSRQFVSGMLLCHYGASSWAMDAIVVRFLPCHSVQMTKPRVMSALGSWSASIAGGLSDYNIRGGLISLSDWQHMYTIQ